LDGQVTGTATAGDEPARPIPPATTTLAISFFNIAFLFRSIQDEALNEEK
jgi:hypothetical protein